jgi:hypothetical protein
MLILKNGRLEEEYREMVPIAESRDASRRRRYAGKET